MKRTVKAILGGVLLLAGVVMLVTPGPALVLIPLGLAILATEFSWAKAWADRFPKLLARIRGAGANGSNCGSTHRGGWWVAAQHTLTIAVLALAPLVRGQWRNSTTTITGVLLFGIGGGLGIAGVRALGRNRSVYPKPLDDSTLVQHGVYRHVRHPLYSSLMFASVGWALFWASWAGLAAAGALTLMLHAKAVREECWLRERYPGYRAYERRVKRFVPWL